MEQEKGSSFFSKLRAVVTTKSNLLLMVCIALFVVAIFALFISNIRDNDGKALLANDKQDESSRPKIRELNGTVSMLGEGGSFVTIALAGGEMYSVEMSADTKVTQDGVAVEPAMIKASSKVTITAIQGKATDKYDFLAQSVALSGTAEQTKEERASANFKSGLIMRAN